MVQVPAETPVTTPVPEITVATAVLLLDHVPPEFGLPKVVLLPAHTVADPVIAPGVWFTVTTEPTGDPHPLAYEITDVPPATPVTIPEDEPTVATPVEALVHVPAPPGLANVVVSPEHTVCVPVVAPGFAFTVNVAVAAHPDTI